MERIEERQPAIIFDFGGVLLDWNPRHLYRKLFDDQDRMERFLVEIGFSEWNLQQDQGRPFAEAVAELSLRFPHYANHIKAFDERWEESIDGPIQATVDLLYRLKQSGSSLFGLSNWSAETFRRVRHQHAFLNLFEDIVISGEVGLIKPDPRIFHLLLKRMGRRAEECLFIDDSEANVAVARELGLQVIWFSSAAQLEKELIQKGLLTSAEDNNLTI